MGLQSQLNDVGSNSIPFLFVALIVTCVSHLRSIFTTLCHPLDLLRHHHHLIDGISFIHISSAAITIADHGVSLRPFRYHHPISAATDEEEESPMCIFCRNHLKSGDSVCQLPCNHIFHNHKECLGGWLDQMKFNCPLCRSPIISDWRVDHTYTQRRVEIGLPAHFAVR